MKAARLLVLNEPYALRISPALAKEIGINESILLLQIEFLIATSTTKEIDGEIWTYQSLKKLKDDYFPWWSEATISRIAKKLEAKKYIRIGNYNKTGYDRTQWYSLNSEGLDTLTSTKLDVPILQNAKSKRAKRKMDSTQMQNRSAQDERPIPETPTETPTETTPESKTPSPHILMFEALAEVTGLKATLNGGRLGRAAKALVKEYTHADIQNIYAPGGWWYLSDWRGQKGEMPTPEQIIETIGRANPESKTQTIVTENGMFL